MEMLLEQTAFAEYTCVFSIVIQSMFCFEHMGEIGWSGDHNRSLVTVYYSWTYLPIGFNSAHCNSIRLHNLLNYNGFPLDAPQDSRFFPTIARRLCFLITYIHAILNTTRNFWNLRMFLDWHFLRIVFPVEIFSEIWRLTVIILTSSVALNATVVWTL